MNPLPIADGAERKRTNHKRQTGKQIDGLSIPPIGEGVKGLTEFFVSSGIIVCVY